MPLTVRSLHIYPIKSCHGIDLPAARLGRAGLAHDRRWMILGQSGQFMTQRQWPRMALIRPSLTADVLRLSAPDMPDLDIALDGSQLATRAEPVVVWRDTVQARAESDEAAQWLSRFLGQPCRLVKVDAQARRAAKPQRVQDWCERHPDVAGAFAGDHHFGFADGFPLLVINQASLDDLNARLAAKGVAPVPVNRFRPNIVLEGDDWQAFEEDVTALVDFGAWRIALVKPCTRCSIPDIDQETAQQYQEPGLTLAAYRTLEEGVVFGQNGIIDAQDEVMLRVGDSAQAELDF